MQSRARILLLIILLFLLTGLTEAQSASSLLESMSQWEPGESYQGGSDYDSRLDHSVQFWVAGASLATVFADIERQTGVRLGFLPEGDENTRVRVHLFLNRQDPPTLREFMAQLMWVVACPFFATDAREGKAYYLMSTSIAGGASQNLQARAEAIWEARKGRWVEIDDKLEEYRLALRLSPEELIERYRGHDDLILLNLLDPARRAVAEFMCRHAKAIQFPQVQLPDEGGELHAFGQTIPATSFTSEDISGLTLAFGLPESVLSDPNAAFDIDVEAVGRLRVNMTPDSPQKWRESAQGCAGPYLLVDLTDEFSLSAPDELALRRALGEKIRPDQEASYLERLQQELAAKRREREQLRLDSERSLSQRAEDLLMATSLTLPNVDSRFPLTPWIAQEAVAQATGMNVVSDGLLWSGKYNYGYPPYGERKTVTVSALTALDSFTHEQVATGLRRPSWEWGDAGDFLRFRTADRDIWRAAMLPQGFIDSVEGLLQPQLPEPGALAEETRFQASIPVEPMNTARMLGQLSNLQMSFGADINYGDPTQLATIIRHQAIAQILAGATTRPKLTRFLASLSDSQWRQLEESGLRFDHDLSPDQRKMLTSATVPAGQRASFRDRVVVLVPALGTTDWCGILVKAEGSTTGGGQALPCACRVLQIDAALPE